MERQIFVNLPVKELDKTVKFFTKLGFKFNPQFTDEMIRNAIAAGGKEYRQAQDHGWMYSRAFEDLDGHIWEVLYADMSALPEEMKNK